MNLSIKNVPDDVVGRLRRRAERNHRSLQGELLTIIEVAARDIPPMTPREIFAEVQKLGIRTSDDAVAIVRADRERN